MAEFLSEEEALNRRRQTKQQENPWWQHNTHQPAGPAWGDEEREEHARQVRAFFAGPKMEAGPDHQEYMRDLAGDSLVVGRDFWEWVSRNPVTNEKRLPPRW